MADGFNEARAFRVTELMRDYQAIQQKIAAYSAAPPPGAQNEAGFVTLKQCKDEARVLLNKALPPDMSKGSSSTGSDDAAKRGLQSVIMDASARRFRAQRIYLRATAAMKWIGARAAIVKGGPPKPADQGKLKAISDTLRQELQGVTDQRVYNALRTKDQQAGFWLTDDPSLNTLVSYMKSHP